MANPEATFQYQSGQGTHQTSKRSHRSGQGMDRWSGDGLGEEVSDPLTDVQSTARDGGACARYLERTKAEGSSRGAPPGVSLANQKRRLHQLRLAMAIHTQHQLRNM